MGNRDEVSESRDPVELTPAMFHILLSLADGAQHGYAIMQDVERATGGEMRLPPGTLYRSIKRLLAAGLIDEAAADGGSDDDERRRTYEISPAGRAVAARESRRLANVVGLARARNLLQDVEDA